MTPELVAQIVDGGGTLALAVVVWVMLRDHGRSLRAIERGIAVLCDRRKNEREPTGRHMRGGE